MQYSLLWDQRGQNNYFSMGTANTHFIMVFMAAFKMFRKFVIARVVALVYVTHYNNVPTAPHGDHLLAMMGSWWPVRLAFRADCPLVYARKL